MYDIKNLTNEVQYLFFKSGKECFLAGNDSMRGVRDSEITSVIQKMKDRKIISLLEIKSAAKSTAPSSSAASLAEGGAESQEKAKAKPAARGKK